MIVDVRTLSFWSAPDSLRTCEVRGPRSTARAGLLLALLVIPAIPAGADLSLATSSPTTSTSPETTTTLGPSSLACEDWDVTVLLSSASAPVGHIQVSIDYSDAVGGFVGDGDQGEVECESFMGGGGFASIDADEESILVFAAVASPKLSAPSPVFRCTFRGTPEGPSPAEFHIIVDDASDGNGHAVTATFDVAVTPKSDSGECESFCGDGVQWGDEECDDGDASNSDACPSTCLRARCGDGFRFADCNGFHCTDGVSGREECDNGDTEDDDFCTQDCLAREGCGDVVTDGKILTGDALYILQSAVNANKTCPSRMCDSNSDGKLTANDALGVLRRAVKLPITLSCPAPTALVVVLDQSSGRLRDLDLRVDYEEADAMLIGAAGEVECVGLLAGGTYQFRQGPGATLRMTVANLPPPGFKESRALARCQLTATGQRLRDVFATTVLEATSQSDQPTTAKVSAIVY